MKFSEEHCLNLSEANIINELGNKYGKLTVIGRSKKQGKANTFWDCKCLCGKVFSVSGAQLRGCKSRKGQTKCINCRNKENSYIPADPESPLRQLLYSYKRTAKNRGYCFELTKDQFKALVFLPCVYCGKEPSNIRRRHRQYIMYSGIDRIDNLLGYTEQNCAPCCESCNIAKHTRTKEEFFSWVKLVYERNRLQNGGSS